VSDASDMLPTMIFSVRVDYQSTMGEVGRVLRAVDQALGDQGIVWASSERATLPRGRFHSPPMPAVHERQVRRPRR
jgi:hypothetical protein